MERFWAWFVGDIKTPGTLIVLGLFAFLAISALIARRRKRRSAGGFVLWEIVSAVASLFK